MKGISRIDSRSTRGWFVRGYRNGKTYSKLFSDGRCKGRDAALENARKYRDKLHAKVAAIPKSARARRFVTRNRRNTSGVIGVTKIKRKAKDGSLIESYSVSWRPLPGVQRCTSFSIRKYGEKRAFALACRHRKRMLKKIYGAQAANQ